MNLPTYYYWDTNNAFILLIHAASRQTRPCSAHLSKWVSLHLHSQTRLRVRILAGVSVNGHFVSWPSDYASRITLCCTVLYVHCFDKKQGELFWVIPL